MREAQEFMTRVKYGGSSRELLIKQELAALKAKRSSEDRTQYCPNNSQYTRLVQKIATNKGATA